MQTRGRNVIPISDELINFGVFVFGDGIVRSHFIKNWKRVRTFELLSQFVAQAKGLSEEDVRKMIQNWGNSIRFTDIRGSLLPPDELLPAVAKDFLIDPPEITGI